MVIPCLHAGIVAADSLQHGSSNDEHLVENLAASEGVFQVQARTANAPNRCLMAQMGDKHAAVDSVAFGVDPQIGELHFELIGRPQIVAVAVGYPFAASRLQTCIAGTADAAVCFEADDAQPLEEIELTQVIFYRLGRAIVNDQDLIREDGLIQNRSQAFLKPIEALVDRNDRADGEVPRRPGERDICIEMLSRSRKRRGRGPGRRFSPSSGPLSEDDIDCGHGAIPVVKVQRLRALVAALDP